MSYPTDADLRVAYGEYVDAVGRVAHTLKYLLETLGQFFSNVVNEQLRDVALAVWCSTRNDRAQRQMPRAAIQASIGH